MGPCDVLTSCYGSDALLCPVEHLCSRSDNVALDFGGLSEHVPGHHVSIRRHEELMMTFPAVPRREHCHMATLDTRSFCVGITIAFARWSKHSTLARFGECHTSRRRFFESDCRRKGGFCSEL